MMKAFNTHYYHFNYILMKNKFFELKMIINLSNPILMMMLSYLACILYLSVKEASELVTYCCIIKSPHIQCYTMTPFIGLTNLLLEKCLMRTACLCSAQHQLRPGLYTWGLESLRPQSHVWSMLAVDWDLSWTCGQITYTAFPCGRWDFSQRGA